MLACKRACTSAAQYARSLMLLVVVVAFVTALSVAFVVAKPNVAYADDVVAEMSLYMDEAGTKDIDSENPRQLTTAKQLVELLAVAGDLGVKNVKVELKGDINTESAGRIEVPEGLVFQLNLNGHMINRGKANTSWYAKKEGEVIYLKKNATLKLDGGTGDAAKISHPGQLSDTGNRFWQYKEDGTDYLEGGLITGGACDDEHGSGGISLSEDGAKAYLKNVTVAGNLTDQFDSSYGHGAGVALHGENCYLELDNSKIIHNHAEGTGGGIYIRKDNCELVVKKGSEISNNLGVLAGGGVYVDGNDCTLKFDDSKVNENGSHNYGGGLYYNSKRGTVTIVDSEFNRNFANSAGGAIYDNHNDTSYSIEGKSELNQNQAGSGGGVYLNDKAKLAVKNSAKIIRNWAVNGGGVYVDEGGTSISLTESAEISDNHLYKRWFIDSHGGGIYYNGSGGSITLSDNAKMADNSAPDDGGAIYSVYNGTKISLNLYATISGNKAANGSGIYLEDAGDVSLKSHASITGNSCSGAGDGGGIYLNDNDSSVTLADESYISGNSAAYGGGIFNNGASNHLYLNDYSYIKDNSARIGGGAGIYSYYGFNIDGSAHSKIYDDVYAESDLFLKNLTIDATLQMSSVTPVNFDFEMDGLINIKSLIIAADEKCVSGGKLAKGSKIGVVSWVGANAKIAKSSWLSNFEGDSYKDAVYSTSESYYLDLKDDYLYQVVGSPDRKLDLYTEDNDQLDSITVQANSTASFNNADEKYKNSEGLSPAWWVVGGNRIYPDEKGQINIKIGDNSVQAYAHYATFHTVTLKYGDGVSETQTQGTGAVIVLTASYYKKGGVSPAYWSVTANDGSTWNVMVASNGCSSISVPDSDIEVVAQYPALVDKLSFTIGESAAWDDIDFAGSEEGKIDGVTVNSFTTTDKNGAQGKPTAQSLADDVGFSCRIVDDNEEGTSKTVSYWMLLSREVFASCGTDVSDDLEAKDVSVKISFGQMGTVDAKVTNLAYTDLGSTYMLIIEADYDKPSETDHSVVAKSVNSKNPDQIISTQAYKVNENGSATISIPEATGWNFVGWDTENLPDCAKLDDQTGEITVTKPSDDYEIRALFKPQASKLSVNVAPLEIGKALPSNISSASVTTFEESDISAIAKDDSSISWEKVGDSSGVAPTTVEADSSYKASITFKYSEDGSEFDWLETASEDGGSSLAASAFVNGTPATSFSVDKEKHTATVSYMVTVGSDATYGWADEGELTPVALLTESDYKNHLPSTITYYLKNAASYTADITWGEKSEVTSTGFKVSGTFKDLYGDEHEVSRSFTLEYSDKPKASLNTGTYAGTQKVTIEAPSSWAKYDESEIKLFYAIGKPDVEDSSSLEFKEYDKDSGIEINESCKLFIYAKVSDLSSDESSYGYEIKEGHSISVTSGKVTDAKGDELSEAFEGQTIYLSAAEAEEGKVFDKWVVEGDTVLDFVDASKPETSFTMPNANLKIKATYKDEPTEPTNAASADVYLPQISEGTELPKSTSVTFAGSDGANIDVQKVKLVWSLADGTEVKAGTKAQAGASYIVKLVVSLDDDSKAVLAKDTVFSFNGEKAMAQAGPDKDGSMTAYFKLDIPGGSGDDSDDSDDDSGSSGKGSDSNDNGSDEGNAGAEASDSQQSDADAETPNTSDDAYPFLLPAATLLALASVFAVVFRKRKFGK